MKPKRLFNALFTVILIFFLSSEVYAVEWEDFTDISGHWAEKTVRRGFDDGLITGLDESTVAPDAPITTAQMITILCRVLGVKETADISELGIPSDVWYAESAGKALGLGLISAQTGSLDAPMRRQDALSMTAKAFCLIPADPDYSVLNSFSDASNISAKNKGAMAALVSEKLIQGFDGSLNVNGKISRSEFLTVLYRIAENYISPDALTPAAEGGSVLKGGGTLSYIKTGKLWFDCSAENITLSGLTADSVTLRSHKLSNFNIYGSSNISRLIVNVGNGSLSLDSNGNAEIGMLRLESCTNADIGSDANAVEITGNGISAGISGRHDYLIISGNNNIVTLSQDVSLSRLKITGENNSISMKEGSSSGISACDAIEIAGKSNTLSFNVSSGTPKITAGGTGNKISSEFAGISVLDISGAKANLNISFFSEVTDLKITGNENLISLKYILIKSANEEKSADKESSSGNAEKGIGGGIGTASVSGDANWITLSCGNMSSLSVSGKYNTVGKGGSGSAAILDIPGSDNAFTLFEGCEIGAAKVSGKNNSINIDGTAHSVTLDGRKNTLSGSGKVKLLTINASGCTVKVAAESVTDNSGAADVDRVLQLVTLGYRGNYTLKWAQEHDYEDYEKEIWVNAKGYSSHTEYLIWVNLSMQRVNIFKGSKGDWELCYSCIVGTGAQGSGTPVGTWTTTYKLASGWNTSTYTVKPVVGFRQGTGYAFHSRLYHPGTTRLSDPSIGYPISHGCVRMYDEDVRYIYENIPSGTTVVVY